MTRKETRKIAESANCVGGENFIGFHVYVIGLVMAQILVPHTLCICRVLYATFLSFNFCLGRIQSDLSGYIICLYNFFRVDIDIFLGDFYNNRFIKVNYYRNKV